MWLITLSTKESLTSSRPKGRGLYPNFFGQASLAAVICTIAGVALPIFGLLIPYSGLTLSLAGLLSGGWLAVQSWYKLWNCEVSQN